MPDDLPITDEQPQGHRAGAWVVLIIGVVGLGLGVYQWRTSFKTAFAIKGERFKTADQVEAERIVAMKTKDTDGDGVSDYDETYVYKTSPYLADSDSDGVDDKTEIAAGDDPNCPKDKECAVGGGEIVPAVTASGTSSDQLQADVVNQLLNPTPEQIRQLLIQSGAKAEDVKNIDDATLQELYAQSLQEAQSNLKTGN